ncbi:MAG: hypothetical protein AAF927_31310 [Bacteroidota bacterium]
MTLEDILPKLVEGLPEYNFELIKQFGRPSIKLIDNYKRGARIYLTNNKLQVVAMAPTVRGAMLSGQGNGVKANHIKDFYVPSQKAFRLLNEAGISDDIQIELLEDPAQVEQTEKGKRSNHIAAICLGIALIGLAIYLYFEFKSLEEEGGTMRLNWILVLIYETLGKEATAIIMSLLGGVMIYSGYKGLATKASNSGE